jgi:hypothetical protein
VLNNGANVSLPVFVLAALSALLHTTGPLRLARPLVTFDIESTGTNVTRDRIVEIAAIKLMPDGTVSMLSPDGLCVTFCDQRKGVRLFAADGVTP